MLIFNIVAQTSQLHMTQEIFPKFSPSDLVKYTSVPAINKVTGKNRTTSLVLTQNLKTVHQQQNKYPENSEKSDLSTGIP